jgi:hypothetical protein
MHRTLDLAIGKAVPHRPGHGNVNDTSRAGNAHTRHPASAGVGLAFDRASTGVTWDNETAAAWTPAVPDVSCPPCRASGMCAGNGRCGHSGLLPALPPGYPQRAGRICPVHSRVLQAAAYTRDLAGAGVIGACSHASPGNRDRTSPARHLALSRHPAAGRCGTGPGASAVSGQRCGCMRVPCVGAEPGKKSRRLRKVKGARGPLTPPGDPRAPALGGVRGPAGPACGPWQSQVRPEPNNRHCCDIAHRTHSHQRLFGRTRPEGQRQSGSAVRDVAPATGHGPDDSLVSQVGDGAPDCGACYAEQVPCLSLRATACTPSPPSSWCCSPCSKADWPQPRAAPGRWPVWYRPPA